MKLIMYLSIVICIAFATLIVAETDRTIVETMEVPAPEHSTSGHSERKFKNIMIIVLENTEFWAANLNVHFSQLAKQGLLLTNYKATTHPSQPNYISMIAGDTMGVNWDGNNDIEGTNLVDLMEKKGVSWKAYQEDYPGNCFSGEKSDNYRRKHNPFISFNNIRNDADRCAKIVHSDELWKDIDANSLPQFMFYTPDMQNDGHDTSISFSAEWASKFINKLLKHQAIKEETLIVLTFDEGFVVSVPNMIFTLLIGPGIHAGEMDNTRYTHYSLLRTVEDNFGLGTLGRNDVEAIPFAYKNNPPSFILTVEILAVIVIASGIVLVTTVTVCSVFIYRRCKRAKMQKLKEASMETDGTPVRLLNEPKFIHLHEEEQA